MKILVAHPTGNRNVRAVISSFADAGLLSKFRTTLAVDPSNSLIKLMPDNIREEFMRRSYPIDSELIETHPFLELARNILPKIGFKKAVEHEVGFACIQNVYKDFDKTTATYLNNLHSKEGLNAVYAYEDGALQTFVQAKALGITCIYDLPIAYWETLRTLIKEESLRMPSWKQTLGGGIKDSQEKIDRKTRELELADVVVGPGKFVLNSLPVWAAGKALISSPFGSPKAIFPFDKEPTSSKKEGPLRVLFVGSLGQRKGLGDLFQAIKMLDSNKVELIIMGSLLAPMEFYKSELPSFTYEKGRPHHKVLELMQTCDVFCLPSIVEGRALVMQEAMSQGLPLLITPNTGGEDLVIEGKTGFIVPIRSPEAIAEKLNWYIENRENTKLMGLEAIKHSATYTWKGYGDTIVEQVLKYSL